MADIPDIGTSEDIARRQSVRVDSDIRRTNVQAARKLIYDEGKPMTGIAVETLLKSESLVPTLVRPRSACYLLRAASPDTHEGLYVQNAFSERLDGLLPNFHDLFVPDFLHEWELGVWKNIMVHLIRILHVEKGSKVRDFNERSVHGCVVCSHLND